MSDFRNQNANPYLVKTSVRSCETTGGHYPILEEQYQKYKERCEIEEQTPLSWKDWLAQHDVYNTPQRHSKKQEEQEERRNVQTDHERREEERRRHVARAAKYEHGH